CPLDCSLHSEKRLNAKQQKKEYHKQCEAHAHGAKRGKECNIDKITQALQMIKRAVKHGFKAKYVLADSWFGSKGVIQSIRQIKNNAMHIICGIRKDRRLYNYKNKELNAQKLLSILKKEKKEKRCRKRNTRYYEVIVDYEGIGSVKLYFCRFPYQKKWRLFLSTDTSLSFLSMLEIYSIRWSIEVFFKECKQQLNLGKCKSRSFDAQIAHVTTCYILYIFLTYFRRVNAYESLGGLFECIKDELIEKNVAQRLWELFDELLQVVITSISESGVTDIKEFKNSPGYQYLKKLFEESFLGNQLMQLNNVA
ncbi:MAG: transposase, partial [Clostridia bacterium]|nr:transposase [Clostridia bacterium]